MDFFRISLCHQRRTQRTTELSPWMVNDVVIMIMIRGLFELVGRSVCNHPPANHKEQEILENRSPQSDLDLFLFICS